MSVPGEQQIETSRKGKGNAVSYRLEGAQVGLNNIQLYFTTTTSSLPNHNYVARFCSEVILDGFKRCCVDTECV